MKTLQSGDSGRDVEVWQRFLARIWIGELDTMMLGTFDEATVDATRIFQERQGVEPSGLVDRETIEQAELLGLGNVEALIPKGFSKTAGLALVVLIVAASLLSQCMLSPRGHQVDGRPFDNPRTPGAPPRSACPGWFC